MLINNQKKKYYEGLKRSFEIANQPLLKLTDNSDFEFERYRSNNAVYPNKYNKPLAKIETSFETLESHIINHHDTDKAYHPQSHIPDINSWNMYYDDLLSFEKIAKIKWGLNHLGESSFLELNPVVLGDSDSIGKIDKRIHELLQVITKVGKVSN